MRFLVRLGRLVCVFVLIVMWPLAAFGQGGYTFNFDASTDDFVGVGGGTCAWGSDGYLYVGDSSECISPLFVTGDYLQYSVTVVGPVGGGSVNAYIHLYRDGQHLRMIALNASGTSSATVADSDHFDHVSLVCIVDRCILILL